MSKYWWQIHYILCLCGEARANKNKQATLDLSALLIRCVSSEISGVTATIQVTDSPDAVCNNKREHVPSKKHMSTACRKAAGEAFSVQMLALVTLCRSICWGWNPNMPLSFGVSGYDFTVPEDKFGMYCLLSDAHALWDFLCVFFLMSSFFFFFPDLIKQTDSVCVRTKLVLGKMDKVCI